MICTWPAFFHTLVALDVLSWHILGPCWPDDQSFSERGLRCLPGSIRAGKRPRFSGGKAWARTFPGTELSVHPSVPATAAFCCRDSNREVKAGLVPEWASCMIQPGEHSDSEPWLLSSGCKQTAERLSWDARTPGGGSFQLLRASLSAGSQDRPDQDQVGPGQRG